MKTLEEQGVINRPTKCGSSFFLSKPLHETIDNNSSTIDITPTISLPSNTSVCPNDDTQLQNLTQMSPVKSNSKGINTNNESNILIESRYNSHIKKRTH